MRRLVLFGFLGAAVLVVASIAGAAKDRKPPSAPRISGPGKTLATSPKFVVTSHDDTTPAAKIRFRCAFDSTKLHSCKSHYSESLTVRGHQLFAQAVDLAGNRSKVSSFGVTISAPPRPPEHPDIAKARAATDKYHSLAAAQADGYALLGGACAADPVAGGMGFHYENLALEATPEVVAEKPEVLLYAASPTGGFDLIGAEYMRRADQGDAPRLFDQIFAGPMPGHHAGMPEHYDLHVWLWRDNVNGMFKEFNPRVRC